MSHAGRPLQNRMNINDGMSHIALRCVPLGRGWKVKHSVGDPAVPLQHHLVFVHRHCTKSVAVRWSLNHPRERHMVHSCAFVLVVSTIVVVSSHETHHAAVAPYDGQELIEVPGEADVSCGPGVDGEVT